MSTDPLEDFRRLQRDAAEASQRADRARGRLDADLAALRDKFGCDDEAAAEKLLKRLHAELKEKEGQFLLKKREFEKKLGDLEDD